MCIRDRLSFDPALRHKRHDPDLPPADLSGAYRGVPDSLYGTPCDRSTVVAFVWRATW